MARGGCCAWWSAFAQSCWVRLESQSMTHWGRVTHICIGNLTISGSDNGLSPGQCQAIIWTNDGILLIGPLRTNFSEILIQILTFSFKKMHVKVLSAKRRPFCLSLNVIIRWSCCWSLVCYHVDLLCDPRDHGASWLVLAWHFTGQVTSGPQTLEGTVADLQAHVTPWNLQ